MELKGYHGTTRHCAENIIRTAKFTSSKSNKEWLGTGIYFFSERCYAIWWIKHVKKLESRSASIIAVKLQCLDEEFFDLDLPDNFRKFEKQFCRYLTACEKCQRGAPRLDDNRKRMCLASNVYKRNHPIIKIIAYTFDLDWDTKSGYKYKQKQLCASENSVIAERLMEEI